MKEQRCSVFFTIRPLMIAVTALALAPLAWANSDEEGRCSNRTLRGDYGFTVEGQFLTGPLTGPLRGVAMTHFDGKGNLAQVDHNVVNGAIPAVEWTRGTGTYTVNPDCTGKAEIVVEGRPNPVNLRFVVVRNGKEIRTVVSSAGQASISIGVKVE